jgi:hypothetical protein
MSRSADGDWLIADGSVGERRTFCVYAQQTCFRLIECMCIWRQSRQGNE